AAGNFFKHRQDDDPQPASTPSQPAPPQSSQPARLTITNEDLKSFQARRIESEKRYERRRMEMGLPTVAETRRQRQLDESALLDRVREKSASTTREESYWRGRSRSLRNEIATNEAQINFVQSRLGEITPTGLEGPVIVNSPYGPFGSRTAPNIRSTGAGVIGDAGPTQ